MGGAVDLVKSIFETPEQPDIPEPEIPAQPAAATREDTGAKVSVGTTASKNARVSGGGKSGATSGSGDVLGGLGRGGISI